MSAGERPEWVRDAAGTVWQANGWTPNGWPVVGTVGAALVVLSTWTSADPPTPATEAA